MDGLPGVVERRREIGRDWGCFWGSGGFGLCGGFGRGRQGILRGGWRARGGFWGGSGGDWGGIGRGRAVFGVVAAFAGRVAGRGIQPLSRGCSVVCYILFVFCVPSARAAVRAYSCCYVFDVLAWRWASSLARTPWPWSRSATLRLYASSSEVLLTLPLSSSITRSCSPRASRGSSSKS